MAECRDTETQRIRDKHRQELADLEKEKHDALRRRDAESVEQIEELWGENAQKLEQMAQEIESMKEDMARILKEREQQLRELDERNARYDQFLQEKQEIYNQSKENRMEGDSNSEQTQSSEQEIDTGDTIQQTSEVQHKSANKKRGKLRRQEHHQGVV